MTTIGQKPGIVLDKQTVRREDGDVDHLTSARANIKQAATEIKNMFTLDRFKWVMDNAGSNINAHLAMWGMILLFPVVVPIMFGLEAMDLVFGPIKAAKNGVDAAVHGARSLFQKNDDPPSPPPQA